MWTKTRDGRYFIENIVRFRGTPFEVESAIENTARLDGRAVRIRLPQDPGQAGKAQAAHLVRALAGFTVHAKQVTGHKVTRAGPLSSQVEAGSVYVVEAQWNAAFFEELEAFPEGTYDDQVDAGSDAIEELAGSGPWHDLSAYSGPPMRMSSEVCATTRDVGQPMPARSNHATDTDRPRRLSSRW